MKPNRSALHEDQSTAQDHKMKKPDTHKSYYSKDGMPAPGSELWTNGLICAFEFVRGHRKSVRAQSYSKIQSAHLHDVKSTNKQVPIDQVTEASAQRINWSHGLESSPLMEPGAHNITSLDDNIDTITQTSQSDCFNAMVTFEGSHWVPIGWARISELVQAVKIDSGWASQQFNLMDDEDELTVADVAAPYWERPSGPVWWCHVAAGHQFIDAWLNHAQWLHPAVSIALRDESRLISERMKVLLYEVPVRVAGGLLFELLGQSAGDPSDDEDDIPIVLRSWQAQNFLISVLHLKGYASCINVLGITEVQELLSGGGYNTPKTIHEVIAHLASRLARWDDRLFRKSIFGAADAVELKFMNRRNHEDLNLLSVILNQEIRRLSRQVIRVKWSLHAREEIVFELLQHLKGTVTKSMLEGIRRSTREMIEEQEANRGRLFTVQDVMQSTVRAWLQDKSLRVTHNLAVFGGAGLVLTTITGLFGINVDGIPGEANTPYAFGLFSALLFLVGIVLIAVGQLYLGLKKPITEEQVEVRKLELQELVKMFQYEAETHAQVHNPVARNNLPPTAADMFLDEADYVLIG